MIAELIVENGVVLKGDGTPPFKASIVVDEGKIVEVGDAKGFTADEKLDATRCLAVPGFVNTHTHLSMTLFRGYADDLELGTWLRDHIWPVEAKLTSQSVRAGALLGVFEMIRSGTCAFADMYFFMDEVAEVVKKAGLRASLSYGMIELGDEERGKSELKKGKDFVRNYNGYADGRIKAMYGPHAPNTCSIDFLMKVRELADKDGVGIHIHLLETEEERKQLGENGLKKLEGFLKDDVLAAHCVWLSDSDIELLVQKGVKVSHNPVSNMKLASGIAKVHEMLEKGVCVSIGTDGCASNNNLDMFGTMKCTALLQKIRLMSPTSTTAKEVFSMATLNGAKSLGIHSGIIEKGWNADFICLDLTSERMLPLHNAVSNIVYSATPYDVVSCVVDGKVLMRDRKVLTLDKSEVIDEVEKAVEKLF
jgi:5-methylthioadenosine/S-adenosylhomocysteine deaminase